MTASSATKTLDKLELLKLMLLSREGDRREGILLRQSKGWFQVSGMGHEALAAMTYALTPDDYLFPYYRDRAIVLARGVTNYDLALAYYAKRPIPAVRRPRRRCRGHYAGPCPQHLQRLHPHRRIALLPACGTAWAMQLDDKKTPSVLPRARRCGQPRGRVLRGARVRSLEEKLPVVFMVEDNKYGISTPTDKFLPFHLDLLNMEAISCEGGWTATPRRGLPRWH